PCPAGAPGPGRESVGRVPVGSRAGFCEHFSSSFTLLMRAAGIPARVVTGYQGGELNPVDQIMTVRQSDAHAWTEVFLTGRGWVRIDPTAASMPRRLNGGLAAALPQTQTLPLFMRSEFEWARTLRHRWEATAGAGAPALPAARRPILRIGALYIAVRYGERNNAPAAARLRRLVRELRLA